MKKILIYILSVTVWFISCEKVDKNKVIESRKPIVVNDGPCPEPTGFPDSVNKVVLLEDYTGHTCSNCPTAHDKAQELYLKYPCRLVIASIHCSSFAKPFLPPAPRYTYDFRTTTGTQLDNFFGCSGQGLPAGMVNRNRTTVTNTPLVFGDWENSILKELNKKSVIKIESNVSLNAGSNAITVDAKIKYLQTVTDSLNLSVFVLEDSIYAWQTDKNATPSVDVLYWHRHVFRMAATATFGDPLSNTTKVRKDSLVKSFSIPLDVKWNTKKLSIVTFVSRKSSNPILDHKILQANEVKVK
jgi:thiol-disulfide isomerase/thioredoxin